MTRKEGTLVEQEQVLEVVVTEPVAAVAAVAAVETVETVEPESGTVDITAFQAALKKVLPFTGAAARDLANVWIDVDGGLVGLTTADGYQMAHTEIEADWPNGQWLLDAEGMKALADIEVGEAEVEVVCKADRIVLGDHAVGVVSRKWRAENYRASFYDAVEPNATVVVARSAVNKSLRGKKGDLVGFKVGAGGCTLYVSRLEPEETVACVPLAAQIVSGEAKVAFDMVRLRKAIRHFDAAVTIKLQDVSVAANAQEWKPALFEEDGHWHIMMPYNIFPPEPTLSNNELSLMDWIEEMQKAIRKGEVKAKVCLAHGGMVVTWDPEPPQTSFEFRPRHAEEETI